MSTRWLFAMSVMILSPLATGCTPDRTPTWAADQLALEPPAPGTQEPAAFQTWTVYGPRWSERPRQRFFNCSVVIQLELSRCEEGDCVPCPACDVQWLVTPGATDSDCDEAPELPQLTAVGVGELDPSLLDDPRAEGATGGTWARYDDDGWLPHGWSDGAPDAPSEPPLTGRPAFAWDLTE